MLKINDNVYLVNGYKKSAIYDLENNKVYSINQATLDIINQYAFNNMGKDSSGIISKLFENKLLSKNFKVINYTPAETKWKLEIAWLEVTQKCNLKCLHCYEGQNHTTDYNPLTLNEWFILIDELADLGVKHIVVIGGEPACYHNINEILTYISQYNIEIVFFTNATLLNDKLIKVISDKKIYVKCSIYGHNAVIHDSITTVKGSFAKSISNIKKLLNNNIEVEASLVIMRENQDYIDEITAWLASMNLIFKRFDIIRETPSIDISLHRVTNIDIIRNIYRTKPNFYITREKFFNNINYNTCWSGKIAICENGDLLPCVFARDTIYGNIRKMSITQIINDIVPIKCNSLRKDVLDQCKVCEYRYACNDCRPLAKSCTKSIFGKTQRCQYNPYAGIWEELN